jgi:hypothetical protein
MSAAPAFCYWFVTLTNPSTSTLSWQKLPYQNHRIRPYQHEHTRKHHTSPFLSGAPLYSSSDESQPSSSNYTNDPSRFFEFMSPIDSVQPEQMSASTLAYLGDVVFELFIRSRYVWPERRMSDLQNKVVSIVRGT